MGRHLLKQLQLPAGESPGQQAVGLPQAGRHRRGKQGTGQQNRPVFPQVQPRLAAPQPGAQAKHGLQHLSRRPQAVRPEQDPGEIHHQEGEQPLADRRPAPAQMAVLFQHQQHKIEQAPHDKGPVGPVPDSGEQPHHKEVSDVLSLGVYPAAPQGEVYIVPEPGGQGDVPPPPELRDRAGDIGIIEVLQKVKLLAKFSIFTFVNNLSNNLHR